MVIFTERRDIRSRKVRSPTQLYNWVDIDRFYLNDGKSVQCKRANMTMLPWTRLLSLRYTGIQYTCFSIFLIFPSVYVPFVTRCGLKQSAYFASQINQSVDQSIWDDKGGRKSRGWNLNLVQLPKIRCREYFNILIYQQHFDTIYKAPRVFSCFAVFCTVVYLLNLKIFSISNSSSIVRCSSERFDVKGSHTSESPQHLCF